MISLNLEELDLIPMDYVELQESEGGFWPMIGAAVVAGIIADWSDFKKGLAQGLAAN